MQRLKTYYNEIDPYAAQWLRTLIAKNILPPGDVDGRSILDVTPDDLKSYRHCHFFAGIGGWPIALQLADFPPDREIWTGSCPCQPFSAAGQGRRFADERHLWPYWFHLIDQRRPATILGEQVASKAGLEWFDLVWTDLEGADYAVGVSDLCAAGVGAPHIRQRLWFVADANGRNAVAEWVQRVWEHGQQPQDGGPVRMAGFITGKLGDAGSTRLQEQRRDGRIPSKAIGADARQAAKRASSWDDCEWLPCTDGKARPVESGTFPLAHGVQRRPSKLRAYGNAIVPQVAAEFIKAYLECRP